MVTRLYPNDATFEFALATSLKLLGRKDKADETYRRVLSLEHDFTAAYL